MAGRPQDASTSRWSGTAQPIQECSFFCRPIYFDETDVPASIEFGVLRRDGRLWVRCFENRATRASG
jgi:hypothetical protein